MTDRTRRLRFVLVPIAVAALAACVGRDRVPVAPPVSRVAANPASPAGRPQVSERLVHELAMITLGHPMDDARTRSIVEDIRSGKRTLESLVDELVASDEFAGQVAPELIFHFAYGELASEEVGYVLKQSAVASGEKVFHLYAPCAVTSAVRVEPWWAPGTQVLVCPDSYRPERLKNDRGWYCGGANLSPTRTGAKYCGCGPKLVNCVRDDEHYEQVQRELRDELWQTTAFVVKSDRPVASLFTMNETVRRHASDVMYARLRVAEGDYRDVPPADAASEAEARPRLESAPGEHAGVLTTPHVLLSGDAPRHRMLLAYSAMWCKEAASVRVGASQVLSLGKTDLRDGDGWKQLAAMPVCTECHARLDYGMQFFAGFPNLYRGLVFEPRAQANGREGDLYVDDIRDHRGKSELTPAAFAALAVRQPEFARCMVRDVVEHVFNDSAEPEDVSAIADTYAREPRLKGLMKAALLRYARRSSATANEPSAPAPGSTDSLQGQIESNCAMCHRSGAHRFPNGPTYPKELVLAMLTRVAYWDMPRSPSLISRHERERFIDSAVDFLWESPASRAAARDYFLARMRGAPTFSGSANTAYLTRHAHVEGHIEPAFQSEHQHDQDLGGGATLSITARAVEACRSKGGDLSSCLDQTLQFVPLVKTGASARP